MSDQASIAISFDALFAKSQAYVRKALRRKADADFEEYQLWASLALELLGKAALAKKHPCLIADPNHSPSLFVAAGVSVTTDVKTISAKTLFERLRQIQPLFDGRVQSFCTEMAERRNSELHSAIVPFKTMKTDAWENRYWHACFTILLSFDSSFEEWIGPDEAEEPIRIVKASKAATFALAQSKIEAARQRFLNMPQKDRDQLVAVAANVNPAAWSHIFEYINEAHWPHSCPACSSLGYFGGDSVHEAVTETEIGFGVWETVLKTYSADEFACPVCQLSLAGEELEAAGLEREHEEEEEREVEYEPEYGNC